MSDEIITNTSVWSLVVQRVTATTVEVWVGTLFPTLKKPLHARVVLTLPDGKKRTKRITTAQWQRPFDKMKQRFYCVCTFTNLQADTHYTLSFERRIEQVGTLVPQSWQKLRKGQFKTLPLRVPLKGKKPFTIALASCFYNHRDGGRAAEAYKALYERGPENVKPDVTFLTGDQVYLDIGFDSLSFVSSEIRQRIADDYAQHWRALGSILSRGGTWMLPDDHEYWNDYPFYKSVIPTLQALRISAVRKAWDAAAQDGVRHVQRCPDVEVMTLGQDLSVCFADFRSYRDEEQLMPDEMFKKVVQWAEGLQSPGILVSPQPLIVEKEMERNLLSYQEQYAALLKALSLSGHDVVLLSGDVHFGRIASVKLGDSGSRLIEIIASPLSNLTYLDGIATDKPKSTPKKFPSSQVAKLNSWQPQNVNYHDKVFQVSTKKGSFFSAYPKERTREHFMTISLSRLANGRVELAADAWRVREHKGSKRLPVKDFARSFKVSLS